MEKRKEEEKKTNRERGEEDVVKKKKQLRVSWQLHDFVFFVLVTRRRQTTADKTGEERAEERRANSAGSKPEGKAEPLDVDKLGIEAHHLGTQRQYASGGVRVDGALLVGPERVQERHETAERGEPGQNLKEAEEPERTLKAEFAET